VFAEEVENPQYTDYERNQKLKFVSKIVQLDFILIVNKILRDKKARSIYILPPIYFDGCALVQHPPNSYNPFSK
jgi:hypothetical protein